MGVNWVYPGVSDFKSYFVRDFPYGNSDLKTVQDADISSALTDMNNTINGALFVSQSAFTTGALNLAAHYLVMNLRASGQGISGQWPWMQSSKGVGNVNESFAIPQEILDNPMLSMYTKTYYGTKYILFVYPFLKGQVIAVCGGPNP